MLKIGQNVKIITGKYSGCAGKVVYVFESVKDIYCIAFDGKFNCYSYEEELEIIDDNKGIIEVVMN